MYKAGGKRTTGNEGKRDNEVKIRMTDAELAALLRVVEDTGLPRAVVARALVLDGVTAYEGRDAGPMIRTLTQAENDIVLRAVMELNKIGVNLNQVARRVNQDPKAAQLLRVTALEKMVKWLEAIDQALRKGLGVDR